MTTAPTTEKRLSPGAVALEGHMRICSLCRAVATAKQEATRLCARGRLLALATYGARARRAAVAERKHAHYFKATPFADADVYRVLRMFNVTDPCLQHAAKKLLAAGGRGGGKDISRDIQEAIDTLVRWQEMEAEDVAAKNGSAP